MVLVNFEPVQLLQLLTSTILPLLVALVTKRETRPARRAVLLAGLSVLGSLAAALLSALQTGAPFDLIAALLAAVGSFVIAVATYYGLWTHTGIPVTLQNIGSPAPAAGLAADPAGSGPAPARDSPRHAAARTAAIPGTVLPLPEVTTIVARGDRRAGRPGVVVDPLE